MIGCCPGTVLDWRFGAVAGWLGADQYYVGSHTVLLAVNCTCFVCGGLHAPCLWGGYALIDPVWWGGCESAMAEVSTLCQGDYVDYPWALPDAPVVSQHFS